MHEMNPISRIEELTPLIFKNCVGTLLWIGNRSTLGLVVFISFWVHVIDGNAGEHRTNDIEGWRVLVNVKLLESEPEATSIALRILRQQLQEIIRVIPNQALDPLRKVTLWFSPEYPQVPPRAEYHPGAGWLRENGRDPRMVKGVEFTDIKIFEAEAKRMPNFTLHELAHAYHDAELDQGFENPEIKAAFTRAKASGSYERVGRWNGEGRPSTTERAYAITNPMEYFAESTEAFFSRNDFYPFDRGELHAHDPKMEDLLERLWKRQ